MEERPPSVEDERPLRVEEGRPEDVVVDVIIHYCALAKPQRVYIYNICKCAAVKPKKRPKTPLSPPDIPPAATAAAASFSGLVHTAHGCAAERAAAL